MRPDHAEPGGVHGRQCQQRQNGCNDEAAHDGHGHRAPENAARQRNHRQHCRGSGQHDGAEAPHRRLDDGRPVRHAARAVLLDLVDQDHRVANDHAVERNDAQHGNETKRPAQHQQRHRHTGDPEEARDEGQQRAREALQLQHQQREGDEQHHGHTRKDRALTLAALLHRTGDLDAVARGHLLLQFIQLRPDLPGHRRPLQALGHVTLHRHGVVAPLAPHHPGLPGEIDLGDLRQRDRSAGIAGHIGVTDVGDDGALVLGLPQHDVDKLVRLAILANDAARQQCASGLRQALAADAQRLGFVLIDVQPQRLDVFVPVVIDAAHIGAGAQDLLGLIGPVPNDLGIRAGDAELHRVLHRRPIGQQLDAPTRFRELLGEQRWQTLAQFLALRQPLGQQDGLHHIGGREDRVQRQVEARHAGADPAGHRGKPRLLQHARLEALGQRLGLLDRRALGQGQVDQHLGAAGVREELLLHLTHAEDAEAKHQQRDADGLPAVLNTPAHQAPEAVVERGIEELMHLTGRHGPALQQQRTQVRHEIDRRHPGDHECRCRNSEDREGVFARRRLRQTDRQEADCRDQRARQHGHGRHVIGEGRGAHLVVALFEFAHHHLNRNDRVVHQQTQRDDQRAQRDLVQAHAPIEHGREGDGQHQRNGDGDDQTRPNVHAQRARMQPERQEAHRQHDHDGFDEHMHELAHRGGDGLGLVLNLPQLNAGGQVALDGLGGHGQGLAHRDDVAPLGH
mmetsp:Transcript_42319/g.99329  ORF Transcript_42319/g.99329 Transcript_42319/m.99329 type:complete len:737 (-) Transcript_42319:1283-3493(-)